MENILVRYYKTKMNPKFRKGDILEAKRDCDLVRQEKDVFTSKPYILYKGDRILITGNIGGDKYFKEYMPYSEKEFVGSGIIPKAFVKYMDYFFKKIKHIKKGD